MKDWQLVFLHLLNNFQIPYKPTREVSLLISDIFHCTTAEYSVLSLTTEPFTQFPFSFTFPLPRLDWREPYLQLNWTLYTLVWTPVAWAPKLFCKKPGQYASPWVLLVRTGQ